MNERKRDQHSGFVVSTKNVRNSGSETGTTVEWIKKATAIYINAFALLSTIPLLTTCVLVAFICCFCGCSWPLFDYCCCFLFSPHRPANKFYFSYFIFIFIIVCVYGLWYAARNSIAIASFKLEFQFVE